MKIKTKTQKNDVTSTVDLALHKDLILCSEMTSSKQSEIKNLHSRHVDSQTKHSCATDHRQ